MKNIAAGNRESEYIYCKFEIQKFPTFILESEFWNFENIKR
ncbi:hypothetical protein [Clostridium tagluense]|nr:hypothetical protein [Clostridium tagluense]